MLDAFPTAAAYLASLPTGLGSHDDCLAFDVHEGARRQLLERVPAPELGAALAETLARPWGDRWAPAVHGLTAQLLLVDVLGEPAYLHWIYAEAHRLYDRPFMRHLMRLLSPSLVVMGAASRWGALHRGSTLCATAPRKDGERMAGGAVLRYPGNLFPASFCCALAETFRAALDMAHARAASVQLVEHEHGRALFEIGWDR